MDAWHEFIKVPVRVPHVMHGRRLLLQTVDAACELDEHEEGMLVACRTLDLLRGRLHPTASRCADGFTFADRAEPCYTKHVHARNCGTRCYVDAVEDVYVKCDTEECRAAPEFRLGRLHAESDAYMGDAVTIEAPFLQRGASTAFDCAVQCWMDGNTKVLSLKSPMGTGKSTFVDGLLADMFARKPDMTVLVVTYRQSLASEHSCKMKDHGFVSRRERTCLTGASTRASSARSSPCTALASSSSRATTWSLSTSPSPCCATGPR